MLSNDILFAEKWRHYSHTRVEVDWNYGSCYLFIFTVINKNKIIINVWSYMIDLSISNITLTIGNKYRSGGISPRLYF